MTGRESVPSRAATASWASRRPLPPPATTSTGRLSPARRSPPTWRPPAIASRTTASAPMARWRSGTGTTRPSTPVTSHQSLNQFARLGDGATAREHLHALLSSSTARVPPPTDPSPTSSWWTLIRGRPLRYGAPRERSASAGGRSDLLRPGDSRLNVPLGARGARRTPSPRMVTATSSTTLRRTRSRARSIVSSTRAVGGGRKVAFLASGLPPRLARVGTVFSGGGGPGTWHESQSPVPQAASGE
jgi:hypothetical protein